MRQRSASLIIVDGSRGLLLHLILAALLQLALLGQVMPGHATTHRADDAMMAGEDRTILLLNRHATRYEIEISTILGKRRWRSLAESNRSLHRERVAS